MKRIFALILCLVLATCLMACTPTDTPEQNPSKLLVGFGREDITPEYSVLLGGYSGRWSRQILDPVYATCLAFTDGNNTILVFHMDLINSSGTQVPTIRKEIGEAFGLSSDNVMFCSTHTHSAPSITSNDGPMADYVAFMKEKMMRAAKTAMEDRKPADMYATTTTLKNLNFVRHYYMDDGSVVGDNFGDPTGKNYVKHVQDADNEMQLVRFQREGGKDIVLVNWQVHPIRTAHTRNTFDLSSDVVGSMRTVLEAQMDCYMAYFTGGSGNIDPTSRISSENITSNYLEQGNMMAQKAIFACDSMTKLDTGKVQILRQDMEQTAHNGNVKRDFLMYAFSVGDLAFITAPYEMFDTNGKFIKDNSPFEMTFIATCSNGGYGYVGADWAYEYESYEVGTANWDKGTAESLADGYVEMLNEIYPTRKSESTDTPTTNDAADNHVGTPLGYNLDAGNQLTPDASGVYSVNFLVDGEKKTYKVTDETIATALQTLDFVGLQLDGDTLTGLIRMQQLPYSRLAWNHYVQSIGGTTVKLSAPDAFADDDIILKLPKEMPVYDTVADSSTFGATTTLQKNDCVSIIADETGTPVFAYVISRPAIPYEGTLYCQHCKKDVSWLNWISETSLPTSTGHYLLADDITLSGTAAVGTGDICLDLNGKTVTQTGFGSRIYALRGDVTLSIMDSVGGATMIPASTDSKQTVKWGMTVFVDGESTLNMYGGTMDGSNCTAQYGHGVSITSSGTFNMYNGTILGGTAFGPGSTAVSANGTFNMYGGRIVGGKCDTTTYTNPIGGAAIRVIGITTIYDGIIEGGESAVEGGVLRVCGDNPSARNAKLILKGGTITGGKAPRGGGIFVAPNSNVVISGDVKIIGSENGNLTLSKGIAITIGDEGLGENAQIGITMMESGDFVFSVPADVDVAKHFVSDDTSKKVVNTGNGNWGLK